jgi:hypothetical protein
LCPNSDTCKAQILSENTNKLDIHPSFSTILKDNTRGGLLLSNIIQNIFEQNRLGLPLFLTPKGIKASHDLINMLNLLPVDNSSKFKGDNFLFDYLSKASNLVFRYNMELTLKIINPINVFELPLGSQKVVDGDCSGLYCFKHKNIDKYGIGSALSCRSPKGGGVNKKLNLTQRILRKKKIIISQKIFMKMLILTKCKFLTTIKIKQVFIFELI